MSARARNLWRLQDTSGKDRHAASGGRQRQGVGGRHYERQHSGGKGKESVKVLMGQELTTVTTGQDTASMGQDAAAEAITKVRLRVGARGRPLTQT